MSELLRWMLFFFGVKDRDVPSGGQPLATGISARRLVVQFPGRPTAWSNGAVLVEDHFWQVLQLRPLPAAGAVAVGRHRVSNRKRETIGCGSWLVVAARAPSE
jgi:hypothetical protein